MTSAGLEKSVLFLSLEAPTPGSAPEIHLNMIADGFERAGWTVSRAWPSPNRTPRIVRVVTEQFKHLRALSTHDIVYMRWHVLDIVRPFLAGLMGAPLVLEINGTHDDIVLAHPAARFFRPLLERVTRFQFRQARLIIGVTPGLEDWARTLRGEKVSSTWFPNGAPSKLALLRTVASDPPYVIFVGGLARWQGIDTLLEARRSPMWPTGVELKVVGSGACEERVMEAAAAGEVTYYGRLPRAEAHQLLAGAEVSVSVQTGRLPRNQLGVSPIKVSESLMLGVPTVVSDLPGQADLMRLANVGAVVRPDDPGALASAVAKLIGTTQEARDELGRFAEAHVTWERISAATAKQCELLLHTHQ